MRLLTRIRLLLCAFILGLVLSGLTAIPLRWEVGLLARLLGAAPTDTGVLGWILTVRAGLDDAYGTYPFLAYGTDWLAFGHFVIALAFVGPLRDPVRNKWVVEWGMLACLLVLPMAFIAGPVRQVPLYHQLVDCSFGVVGFVPLMLCRRAIQRLERANDTGSDAPDAKNRTL